jgi:hypothetical protein
MVYMFWICGGSDRLNFLPSESSAHPEFFIGREGAGPDAVCNLCLILKTIL